MSSEIIYEEALLSLLKMGQCIVVDHDSKKYLLLNNGIQVEKLDVNDFSKEEAELLTHGKIIDFSDAISDAQPSSLVN